jgi:hypothetical protein
MRASRAPVITLGADYVADKDVNIYEYANPTLAGIGGAIKCRATDFVVQEIRADGTRVEFERAATPGPCGTPAPYVKCTLVCGLATGLPARVLTPPPLGSTRYCGRRRKCSQTCRPPWALPWARSRAQD